MLKRTLEFSPQIGGGCLERQRAMITELLGFTFHQHLPNSPPVRREPWAPEDLSSCGHRVGLGGVTSSWEGGPPQGRGSPLHSSAVNSKGSWATRSPLAHESQRRAGGGLSPRWFLSPGLHEGWDGGLQLFTVIHQVHQALDLSPT